MDKVLVHRGFSTLDVIAVAFVIVTLFEVLLGGLHSYIFAHTASRIYVELGAPPPPPLTRLLQDLRRRFPAGMPPEEALHAAIDEFAAQTRRFGSFNFLLSNGDSLFAHRTTELHYIIRQAPFPVAHLMDEDMSVDFSEVTTPNDRVAVIVTKPLTDNETWHPLPVGRVTRFHNGAPVE